MLSDICGAGQIGSLQVVVVPCAAAGAFPIGSVMAADSSGKVKMATDADIGNLFGVLVQGRIIADLATEAIPTANVARRGTFRARSKCLSVFAPRRGISRDRSIFPAPVPPRCLQGSFIVKTETPPPASTATGIADQADS